MSNESGDTVYQNISLFIYLLLHPKFQVGLEILVIGIFFSFFAKFVAKGCLNQLSLQVVWCRYVNICTLVPFIAVSVTRTGRGGGVLISGANGERVLASMAAST